MSPAEDTLAARLDAALAEAPVIAILRGLRGDDALEVVGALYRAGIRVAEVPLNSPDPFATIALLVREFGQRMLIGAGTVLEVEQVRLLAACGASLCISPNTDPEVIKAALAHGLLPIPGYATPSEAFAALAAGARHLKFFPANGRVDDLKALRVVLPAHARLVAVGGAGAGNASGYLQAGACAIGIGSELFRPGDGGAVVGARAVRLMAALGSACPDGPRLLANPLALVGESPRWDDACATLRWVDPGTRRLLGYAAGQGTLSEQALSMPVSAIALLPDGQLLGAVADGFALIDPRSGQVNPCPPATLAPGTRLNDMAVDARGGCWAGVMHKGLLAGQGAIVYSPHPGAAPRTVARGLGVPNGMAFSADGTTLYMVDTLARTLLAFAVDRDREGLGEPVIVTDFLGLPGKPDGMARTRDGDFWVAMWGGGCIVRIGADGALLKRIDVPAPQVSSIALGPDGTVYVTSSRARLSAAQLAAAPASGGLFACSTGRAP